ncbi:MAG TPA: C4-dicarboxylic acid transporter DauA [Kofleriaceae bacterium]|nr:C4-dicarboxylic acid transporter DauA [Kofleriaceae bacterium]
MIRRSLRYAEELTDAVKQQLALAYTAKDLLAFGLRSRMREGYSRKDFRSDLMAALVVGVVALPLSMALAIACDVPPQHGLYTAIVAGVVCSLLGGTYFQVTGPTAAFVVILLPIVHKFGVGGLLVAGMLAGLMLVGMGLARLGKLMQFVPHPVTSGFTMGIAIVIGVLQLKDVFGVKLPRTEGVFEYFGALIDARHAFNFWDVGVAVITLVMLLMLPRIIKRIPVPLIALVVAALLVVVVGHFAPESWGFHVTTIGSKFTYPLGGGEVGHGIPPLPPLPVLPWQVADPGHPPFDLNLQVIRELLPSAFAIAMLGAIESLMAAVVADGMGGSRHDPNAELIALGVGNIICPFFGGIAATGALARTATNIRAGARSPLAASMHAIFILACTIALAPLVSYLPMAALAALLIIVARNMSEARHFFRLARIAPKHDVLVMLTCFTLTVVFDMVIAVTVGVVLAALLFMRRMSVLTQVELETPTTLKIDVPPGIRVYEIAGPLFFGAAKSAMEALHTVGDKDHTYVLDMQHVPAVDATGLVAIESMMDRLHRSKIKIIFAGLSTEMSDLFARAGIKRELGKVAYAPDVETAVSMAIVHAARTGRRADTSPSMRIPKVDDSGQPAA